MMIGNFNIITLFSTLVDKLIDYLVLITTSYSKLTAPPKKENIKPIKKMGKTASDPKIWFDGVDKKLLEAHTRKPFASQEADEKTLVTKTPLATLSSYTKKTIKSKGGLSAKKKESSNDIQLNVANNSTNKSTTFDVNRNETKLATTNGHSTSTTNQSHFKDTIRPNTGITDELAIDCEMVECYHNKSVLARVSIVNLFGHPILDKYVAPPDKVTDYRTKYSGIRRKDLVNAPDFDTVQKEVADLINGRIVIGHSIHNDFQVLKLSHPFEKTRDTSEYFKYLFQGKTPSLKKLSESLLGIKIQKGEHDSVQDAQATMKCYVKERDKWNERILKGDLKSTIAQPKKHYQQHKISKKQKTKPMKKKMKTFWVTN